jgi:hypothetical protein
MDRKIAKSVAVQDLTAPINERIYDAVRFGSSSWQPNDRHIDPRLSRPSAMRERWRGLEGRGEEGVEPALLLHSRPVETAKHTVTRNEHEFFEIAGEGSSSRSGHRHTLGCDGLAGTNPRLSNGQGSKLLRHVFWSRCWFWPCLLRVTEADRGRLVIYKIGKRYYTTPADIKGMVAQCRVDQKAPDSTWIRRARNTPSETERASSALAAARETAERLKNSSRNTLGKSIALNHRVRQ